MNSVTLIDGTEVPNDSPAWREECRQRHSHVLNLRRLHLQQRRDYLANVERKEGHEARVRLALAFVNDWDERKTAERQALAEHQTAQTQGRIHHP